MPIPVGDANRFLEKFPGQQLAPPRAAAEGRLERGARLIERSPVSPMDSLAGEGQQYVAAGTPESSFGPNQGLRGFTFNDLLLVHSHGGTGMSVVQYKAVPF